MVFSSLEFLCVFFPIVFLLYTALPGKTLRNGLLILASLLFYAYGEPVYVLLMLGSVLVNYTAARLIAAFPRVARGFLLVGVTINLGTLAIFKYAAFLVETLNQLLALSFPVPVISLPIGISFFTFQALSYLVDVYRGEVRVQKNLFHVLLYISFFPQLIAGPIVKYRDICAAIEDRRQELDTVVQGLRRFLFGLGKKVLIANTVGEVADAIFTAEASQLNLVVAWIGALAYLLQIYYDFSGYSDMAIGLGKMFGFHFQENFIYPYAASSIKEFWRRWHISLSTWFRDYLYIPLGGNRKGRLRTCLNKGIVFFCTGLWHGASWTFVLWGLWHGFFLLLEEFIPAIGRAPRLLRQLYTLLVVTCGFVVFRADTLSQGLSMLRVMFTGVSFTAESVSFAWQQLTPWALFGLGVGIVGAGPIRPLADRLHRQLEAPEKGVCQALLSFALSAAAVLLLCWSLVRLSGNTYNPFIYFRF